MRAALLLLIVSGIALPVVAQTEASSFKALQGIVEPGQMVVITDHEGRETTGIVSDLSDSALTLALGNATTSALDSRSPTRIFSEDGTYLIRRTDSLRDGTLRGMGVGIAAMAAMALSCGRYEFAEEQGPCTAFAVTNGAMWVVFGTLIGRAIDRAAGNEPLYRRPHRASSRVVLSPAISTTGFRLKITVPY